ncbi:MAG TPA: type I-MYXAN CRISPR-associated Cas8a1/Cmx1 [Pirellulales bacterium]|nr:type I-MYXAN CRISPR-associated Cas8a1/Cmx1 [Pirellulales bacterium]
MAKVSKATSPDHLTMQLFTPGMSALHRAGLGGLASTLKSIERMHASGQLSDAKLPGPMVGGDPPWVIEPTSVTLHFGEPERAAAYLKRLFTVAFSIRRDGLIFLPGQFDSEPGAALLADLQSGLALTFLQHGKVRKLAKDPTTATYDPEGDGTPSVEVQYRKCSQFKHQLLWSEFVEAKTGCIVADVIKVDGPVSPGTVVRHVAFTADTAAEDPPERMLPLCFAPVGCVALPVNRGVAILLIPEVENLVDFALDRPAMSPTTATECQIANAADAALQTQIRLRARQARDTAGIPGVYAMTFTPTPWASQQKSRVATIHVGHGDEKVLDRFECALSQLPPRIVVRTVKEAVGRGRKKRVVERKESFRADSVVRPLIADNLALGRPWYAGFVRLMTRINPATSRPFRQQIPFECKGLHAMISDPDMWDHEGEALVVKAVHEAIRQSLGRIREDTDGKQAEGKPRRPLSQATKNRWERFREKLRLDLAGSKTASQLRFALADLFSRGGSNVVLRDAWAQILPVIHKDWQLARDLGLLALASYAGKGGADEPPDASTEPSPNPIS